VPTYDKRPCRPATSGLVEGVGEGRVGDTPYPLQGYPPAVGLPPRPLRPTPSPNRVPPADTARIIMWPHCRLRATLRALPPARL